MRRSAGSGVRALSFCAAGLAIAGASCRSAGMPIRTEAPGRSGGVSVASPLPRWARYEGKAFTFHAIREGIYHAVGTGELAVGCNGAVIVNRDHVLVVDSHMSPAAGMALLREIEAITPLPVRYVVNTHFHFDHVHGNQVFPPEVEIIGHEFTRAALLGRQTQAGRAYDRYIGGIPERVRRWKQELSTTTEDARRRELAKQIDSFENLYEADKAVEPTPPTLTLTHKMTLYRGGREIVLLSFGRGHTGGDIVVYLPVERVLVSGDLLTPGLPYMGDGYLLEWADALEQLKPLSFDVVLPGHGDAFSDRATIDHLQAYLRDLHQKAAALRIQGVPAIEASRRIDMRAHAVHYPSIEDVGAPEDAVLRIYEVLSGRK